MEPVKEVDLDRERRNGNLVVRTLHNDDSPGHAVFQAQNPENWGRSGTHRVVDVNQFYYLRDGLIYHTIDPSNKKYRMLATDLLAWTRYGNEKTLLTQEEAKKEFDKLVAGGEGKSPEDVLRELYVKRGNIESLSFSPNLKSGQTTSDLHRVESARIATSTDQGPAQRFDPTLVSTVIARESVNPDGSLRHAGAEHCSEFVRDVVPIFAGKLANQIADAVNTAPGDKTQGPPPPPPVTPPHPQETPPKDNANPGGVAHNAVAEVSGLTGKPTRAYFDEAQGKLILQAPDGSIAVDLPVTKDEMAVALQCVFVREINPALSIVWTDDPSKRDSYFELKFTGPIFDTSFGRNMSEADQLLGALMFGYLGPERDIMVSEFPEWVDRWNATRLLQIKPVASRVFMCTEQASFARSDSLLKCINNPLRFIHENVPPYAWIIERESTALADFLERNQSSLRDLFPVLDTFARLGAIMALLKWLRREGIPMDSGWAGSYTPTKDSFPIFIPLVEWSALKWARTFDGWQFADSHGGALWSVEDEDFVAAPPAAGSTELALLYSDRVWAIDYELEFLLKTTDGSLEYVCKYVLGKRSAGIRLDSPQGFSLFRISVRAHGNGGDADNIVVMRDGEPFWKGNLGALCAGIDIDLKKGASFGFLPPQAGNARIASIRFRPASFLG